MWTSPSSPAPEPRTVVIGLGNPLMGDDGVGLAALDRLRVDGAAADVELVDGGTWGLTLLPTIESAGRVLFLDAIERGSPAGTLHVLERDEIPRYLATKISPHQVALQDVLALAELRGTLPVETVAIGLEPARLAMGCGLSEPIGLRLDALVAAARQRLASWDHAAPPPQTGSPAHA